MQSEQRCSALGVAAPLVMQRGQRSEHTRLSNPALCHRGPFIHITVIIDLL